MALGKCGFSIMGAMRPHLWVQVRCDKDGDFPLRVLIHGIRRKITFCDNLFVKERILIFIRLDGHRDLCLQFYTAPDLV